MIIQTAADILPSWRLFKEHKHVKNNGKTVDYNADLSEKVILVTGGNSGLGLETLRHLMKFKKQPKQIYFTARQETPAKEAIEVLLADAKKAPIEKLKAYAEAAIKELEADTKTAPIGKLKAFVKELEDEPEWGITLPPIKFLLFDLSNLETMAEVVRKPNICRIDILILNAGVLCPGGTTTENKHNIQFGINYFGHAFLVQLLLPALFAAADEDKGVANIDKDLWKPRIVVVASAGHWAAREEGIEIDKLPYENSFKSEMERYALSKMSNILYASLMAKKYPEFIIVSGHPGSCPDTGIARNFPKLTGRQRSEKSGWLIRNFGGNLFKLVSAKEAGMTRFGVRPRSQT